tara:strand:+ start:70 stop:570 length:501 start_codon:yes stop_codon:yes gene_type:complete
VKIIIETYYPKWQLDFEKESKLLLNSIKEQGTKIEHIGSTSIKGLGAKPVIDIMIGLIDFNTANNHISAITELGYTYVSEFENEMPYRKFFTKEFNGKRSHHIHMVELKTEFWNRHLKFRNHLRLDNEDRDKYMDLKMNLAKREWTDVNEYASAKSEFIRNIEKSS